jgi:hypothetical protein
VEESGLCTPKDKPMVIAVRTSIISPQTELIKLPILIILSLLVRFLVRRNFKVINILIVLTQNKRGITKRDNKFGGAVNSSISHPVKNHPESPMYNEIKAELPKIIAMTVKRRLFFS